MLAPLLVVLSGLPPLRQPVPWSVGESFEYSAHYTFINAGGARLWVDGIDTVRGVPTWRFGMTSDLHALFFSSKGNLMSWTSINPFVSRRFTHHIVEGSLDREDDFRIFGDSGFFRNLRPTDTGKVAAPTDAIDDVAFFYYIRTVPLRVGVTDTFTNYFRRNRNPVTVEVQRRVACELPAGEKAFCLVLHPIVDDPPHGLLMKKRNAHVWITDDTRRIIVQIELDMGLEAPVKLQLEKITRGR